MAREWVWKCRDRMLRPQGRPLIMGILNVTPDSFSDGGRFMSVEAAVAHACRMVEEGADLVDVGGQSTRPGAQEVPLDEERRRVLPVIRALSGRVSALLSVDTMKAALAEEALAAGAQVINDVSALTSDPDMPAVARRWAAGVILMHMRGTPATMQNNPQYQNVVGDVRAYLESRVETLSAAGLERESLAVDPGIGFGKTVDHNLDLLAGLPSLAALGRPVVVGVSRKSFLGHLTGRPVGERLAGSLSALACCVTLGADVLRVHDVAPSRDAAVVAWALSRRRDR